MSCHQFTCAALATAAEHRARVLRHLESTEHPSVAQARDLLARGVLRLNNGHWRYGKRLIPAEAVEYLVARGEAERRGGIVARAS